MPRGARRRSGARPATFGDRPRLRQLQEVVELNLPGGSPEEPVQVRRVSPSHATKAYTCPGCQQEIAAGTGHVVVVPLSAPDLRRHWHSACWAMRERRRPGH
ncbi:MAG TPA: hypothetical protein VK425_04170 [Acidimicrobiales bacterium]|nr:hypothetical protein [Acidimicrobiales bacterium]